MEYSRMYRFHQYVSGFRYLVPSDVKILFWYSCEKSAVERQVFEVRQHSGGSKHLIKIVS